MATKPLLAALIGILAGWPIASAAAGGAAAQGCGPAPPGQVAVVVVVDDGGDVSQRCVVVAERTDGYAVLRAAGHELRIDAGFLCAIDRHPATGCANRPGFDGSYWRYYHATPGGSWVYSSVGAGGYRMPSRCAIEGWRWTSAGGTDTPPRGGVPPVSCEAPPPTAAPTVPPAPTRPATSPTAGGPGAGGGAPVVAGGGAPVGPAGGPTPTPTTPSADTSGEPDAEGTPSVDPGVTTDGVDGAGPDAGEAAGVAGAGPLASDAPEGGSTGDAEGEPGGDPAGGAASDEHADAAGSRGSGSPVGVLLAAVVVVAIGAGALWRNRRAAVPDLGESVEGP